MFIWRYVCLSVCLSGWKITHDSRTHWHNFIKFGTLMHIGLVWNTYWFWNRSDKHTGRNVNFGKLAPLQVRFHSNCERDLVICHNICMAYCKTAVTPLLSHWSYCSLALSHRYDFCCNGNFIKLNLCYILQRLYRVYTDSEFRCFVGRFPKPIVTIQGSPHYKEIWTAN